MTRLLVVQHSPGGTHRGLAAVAARYAEAGGAAVRLRQVPALPGDVRSGSDLSPTAGLDDLEWCRALIVVCPTHFGGPSGSVKAFLDSTTVLWRRNRLQHLVVGVISGSNSPEGGGVPTVLSIQRSVLHWGAVVVSGHQGPASDPLGPYGVSFGQDGSVSPDAVAQAVEQLVSSVMEVAAALDEPAPGGDGPTVAVVADDRPDLDVLAGTVVTAAKPAGSKVVRMTPAAATDLGAFAGVDAVAVGTVARAGLPDLAVVEMLQDWGERGRHGPLAGLPVAAFVTSRHPADGPVSALLAVYTSSMHAGSVVVPAGRGERRVRGGAGNPYGTSARESSAPSVTYAEACYHVARLARTGYALRRGAARSQHRLHPEPAGTWSVRQEPGQPYDPTPRHSGRAGAGLVRGGDVP